MCAEYAAKSFVIQLFMSLSGHPETMKRRLDGP